MVPGHHRGDALANRLDYPSGLMPQDAWEEPLGIQAIEGVGVRVTQSICHDLGLKGLVGDQGGLRLHAWRMAHGQKKTQDMDFLTP